MSEIFVVSKRELDDLVGLRVKLRLDWPAVFSCNRHGDIWTFTNWGHTKPHQRVQIGGATELLDDLADVVLHSRSGGGRFFVDDTGAYIRPHEEFRRLVRFRVRSSSN